MATSGEAVGRIMVGNRQRSAPPIATFIPYGLDHTGHFLRNIDIIAVHFLLLHAYLKFNSLRPATLDAVQLPGDARVPKNHQQRRCNET